jgi:peptide/nickel transport system ATP-binding protein
MSAVDNVLLSIRDLQVQFHVEEGIVSALDGVNLDVFRGETLGLVGETGCGKSCTALSVLRLLPVPPAEIRSGEILFEGDNLLDMTLEEMRRIRGRKISMIFQDPMTSLNPVFTIGNQIGEAIRLYQKSKKSSIQQQLIEALNLVRIADAKERVNNYPHQFSGGMRQRAMIAMMLACRPMLLIADEPTTALDVTIQAQVLLLMQELQQELNMSILLITHDLGVIAETCDRVGVMYAGSIVEMADVYSLFESPHHPYTQGLLGSIPRPDKDIEDLVEITGSVPDLISPPSGCRFHPRCVHSGSVCQIKKPEELMMADGHMVACHLYGSNPPAGDIDAHVA